jgi:hypothetical protein
MTAMPHSNEKAVPMPESESEPVLPNAHEAIPEVGGRGGLEPTRYGDWEKNGRCIDF